MALGTERIVVSGDTQVQAQFDAGLRAHMLRVYNYMASGVAVTGIVAYLVAGSEPMLRLIYGTPLMWVLAFSPLIFFIFMGARLHKMSLTMAQAVYWLFTIAMGLSLSSIFIVYTGTSIARVFFITAAMFAGMSIYGYTTKKDLSGWTTFLMMGLLGLFIAIIVSWFFHSAMMEFMISVVGVILFTALTAYDTQKIKEAYAEHYDEATIGKLAVMGAAELYYDFIMLFIFLLRLLGNRD